VSAKNKESYQKVNVNPHVFWNGKVPSKDPLVGGTAVDLSCDSLGPNRDGKCSTGQGNSLNINAKASPKLRTKISKKT